MRRTRHWAWKAIGQPAERTLCGRLAKGWTDVDISLPVCKTCERARGRFTFWVHLTNLTVRPLDEESS